MTWHVQSLNPHVYTSVESLLLSRLLTKALRDARAKHCGAQPVQSSAGASEEAEASAESQIVPKLGTYTVS